MSYSVQSVGGAPAHAALTTSGASSTASADRKPPYDQPIMHTLSRSGAGMRDASPSCAVPRFSSSTAWANACTASTWSASVTSFMFSKISRSHRGPRPVVPRPSAVTTRKPWSAHHCASQ